MHARAQTEEVTKECQIIALLNYCWLLLTATLLILLLEMKQTRTAHMHTCRRCCFFLFVITGYLHSSYSNVKLRHTSTSAAGVKPLSGRRRRRSELAVPERIHRSARRGRRSLTYGGGVHVPKANVHFCFDLKITQQLKIKG